MYTFGASSGINLSYVDWRLLAKIQSRAFVKFGVLRKEKKTSFGFDKLRPKFRGNYLRLTCIKLNANSLHYTLFYSFCSVLYGAVFGS